MVAPDAEVAGDGDREGLPRWVKVAGIVVALVLLVMLATMLIRGGGHQRPDHGFGGGDSEAPTSDASEAHAPPRGVHDG